VTEWWCFRGDTPLRRVEIHTYTVWTILERVWVVYSCLHRLC
jgi:hypothetical protein